jgi:hypothetical protein
MFAGMPYENSLVVISMNGPQLKAVLERAYRNFYYYKYVPGNGGYSYYTTCMIDTNAGNQIVYNNLYPAVYDPAKQYVVSLVVNGEEVDFNDAGTYYNVSTVNYLAAGSCNFNDSGKSLWPLDQIVHDTQFYVRDAVIDYIKAMGTVSPAIEGRLKFIADTSAPTITVTVPEAKTYVHPDILTLDFSAVEVGDAGLAKVWAEVEGQTYTSGQQLDLLTLAAGSHTMTVYAVDKANNLAQVPVTFTVDASVQILQSTITRFYNEGKISDASVYQGLMDKLVAAQKGLDKGNKSTAINNMKAFINQVMAQSGKKITKAAADLLIADAQYVIAHLP